MIYHVYPVFLNWLITLSPDQIGIQAAVSYITDIHIRFVLYFLKAVFQYVLLLLHLFIFFNKHRHNVSIYKVSLEPYQHFNMVWVIKYTFNNPAFFFPHEYTLIKIDC